MKALVLQGLCFTSAAFSLMQQRNDGPLLRFPGCWKVYVSFLSQIFCELVLSFWENFSSSCVSFQLHVLFHLGLLEIAAGPLDGSGLLLFFSYCFSI